MKGKLIFEGEYIYNYRIRGSEYYKGKLEYEGEYLYNRKFNGKGYDSKGNIIYELNNGNGKVKEYYKNQLRFEGEYLNGKINYGIVYNIYNNKKELEIEKGINLGKEYFDNGTIKFEGEYVNEKRNGKGKEYDAKGRIIFEGEYLNGEKWNGKIKEYVIIMID